jgi:hypothetical protein
LRSSAFPTAAQGEEQIDLAHGNLGVGGGQLRSDVGVGAGRLQVGEERLAPGLEEAVGLVRASFADCSASARASRRCSSALYWARPVWVSRMALSTTPSKCASAP